MNRLKQLRLILLELGFLYVFFRVIFELKKRLGLIERFQQDTSIDFFPIDISEWRKLKSVFVIKAKESYTFTKSPDETLKLKIDRIKSGQYQFFNATWKQLGTSYDWITNPDSGYTYPLHHWSRIPSYNSTAGDIKFVWEKSRFGFITDFIRYDYHFNADNADFVFTSILDWIAKNPMNHGPNYVCSQETSLRIFHWTIALEFYKSSSVLTQENLDKILASIYGQIRHVEQNLNFSRKLVRNNHAITECLCLFLIGTIYPFFPDSKKRRNKGKRLLEKEILFQVYPDGSYIQHSHNYHRVAFQLFTWYLLLLRNTNEQLNQTVLNRLNNTCDFLVNHMQPNGLLPNYGANDGALFFNFTSNNYRNFASQLAPICALLNKPLPMEVNSEDLNWYQLNDVKTIKPLASTVRFDTTGYYRLTHGDITVYIRCGSHPNRPSQADNLHVDIWYKGENVFWDTGSYKYNAKQEDISFFWGTKGHNTIQIGELDQMLKGQRFLWHYWTQSLNKPDINEGRDSITFKGTISCYKHLGTGIQHERTVVLKNNKLSVTDKIVNLPVKQSMHQNWHINPRHNNCFDISSNCPQSTYETACSNYYGVKDPSKMVRFSTTSNDISTTIHFK